MTASRSKTNENPWLLYDAAPGNKPHAALRRKVMQEITAAVEKAIAAARDGMSVDEAHETHVQPVLSQHEDDALGANDTAVRDATWCAINQAVEDVKPVKPRKGPRMTTTDVDWPDEAFMSGPPLVQLKCAECDGQFWLGQEIVVVTATAMVHRDECFAEWAKKNESTDEERERETEKKHRKLARRARAERKAREKAGLSEVIVDGETHLVTERQQGEIQAILDEPAKDDPHAKALARAKAAK